MVFKEILKILQGYNRNFNDLSVPNYSPDVLAYFKYPLITSIDVKHSFSSNKYLYILTDRCYNFTEIYTWHTLSIFPIKMPTILYHKLFTFFLAPV